MRYGLMSSFLFGLIFSLSIWGTPLVADEVFMVFTYGLEFFEDPSRIFSAAVSSSVAGWHAGRFVSPLMHIFGTFGNAFNFGISELLSINLVDAYGFSRSALLAVTVAMVFWLVWVLVPDTLGETAKHFIGSVTVASTIGSMVSNHVFSSIRIFPWAYTAVTGIFLALLISAISIGKWSFRDEKKGAVLFGAGLIGLLAGSTYEFTQLLGPVILVGFLWAAAGFTLNNNVSFRAFFGGLKSAGFLAMFATYFLSFAIIRTSSFLRCREVGCYSTADIRPDTLELSHIFERFLSGSPFFSLRFATRFIVESSLPLPLPALTVMSTLALLAGGFGLFYPSLRGSLRLQTSDTLRRVVLPLGAIGFTISILMAVGMASSASMQGSGGISLGKSLIDTLGQSIGHGMMIAAFLLLVFQVIRRTAVAESIIKSMILVTLSALVVSTFMSNWATTKIFSSSPSSFVQDRLAFELSAPELTARGNQLRCELVSRKLSDFPEWEGHDRLLVYGLNAVMTSRFGVDFCSRNPDDLFSDYK
jgi:hypothetical protein